MFMEVSLLLLDSKTSLLWFMRSCCLKESACELTGFHRAECALIHINLRLLTIQIQVRSL